MELESLPLRTANRLVSGGLSMNSRGVLIPAAHNCYIVERCWVVDRADTDTAKTQRYQSFPLGMSL